MVDERIFNEVPQELEEAALVDGTTDLGAFVRIAFPLAAPGIVASTILSFCFPGMSSFCSYSNQRLLKLCQLPYLDILDLWELNGKICQLQRSWHHCRF